MTNYNDGKWHNWSGGKCPVHPETIVVAIFDNGMLGGEVKAKDLEWENAMLIDIEAFKVVREHKEPREFWLVCGDAYDSFEEARENKLKHDEIIHVREVLE